MTAPVGFGQSAEGRPDPAPGLVGGELEGGVEDGATGGVAAGVPVPEPSPGPASGAAPLPPPPQPVASAIASVIAAVRAIQVARPGAARAELPFDIQSSGFWARGLSRRSGAFGKHGWDEPTTARHGPTNVGAAFRPGAAPAARFQRELAA